MLEKIVGIKNIGCFRNYAARGDVSFCKLTLIHAENGRGKTTFCAILRSLQSGQTEFISERKTLSVTEPVIIHLRLNGADHKFDNDTWTLTYPDVVIFDPVFINENVYSGDYVEHEHKKNLYRIIVGTHGVKLAKQIEDIDKQIREVNNDLRDKKEAISKYVPSGVAFETYLQWQAVEDITVQIQQKSEELFKRQQAVTRSTEIQSREMFSELSLPSCPSDFITILAKGLADIESEAETKVRQQIAEHKMNQQGEDWLSQGLSYLTNDHCPFCGQDVHSNDLLAAYRSYFNEKYRVLKEEITQLSQHIDDAIGESALSVIQQTIASNLTLAEFWKQFVTVELPEFTFSNIQGKYARLREHSLLLVKKKQANPAEALEPNAEYSSALANVESLSEIINGYNVAVKTCNKGISEQKAAAQEEVGITALKSEVSLLESKKQRFEPEIMKICQEYQDSMKTKGELEHNKEEIRQQLDQYCESIIKTYESSINEYLDQFNAGFRITNTRHLYIGGTPSSQYQIEINNTAVDLGDSRTEAGTPCLKTTLSAGDRGALALAFFLAILKQDTDISRKIIVFDDPFTSLDRFRRTCTQQLIQQFVNSAKQVIVLSHDPYFLKLLWDGCPATIAPIKTLQMSKAGASTVVGEWDIDIETQSTYLRNYATLLNFYRERKGESRAVAMAIRPFLEGMLRSHFPGHFKQGDWLGDFIEKIRIADENSGLQHATADLDELDAINGYSKNYHHDQNVNADSEPIDEDELHGYVKRTLRLVGGI